MGGSRNFRRRGYQPLAWDADPIYFLESAIKMKKIGLLGGPPSICPGLILRLSVNELSRDLPLIAAAAKSWVRHCTVCIKCDNSTEIVCMYDMFIFTCKQRVCNYSSFLCLWQRPFRAVAPPVFYFLSLTLNARIII